MRIEQLEYVAAVTQHGSLRQASQHLHISQPALSDAVTKLERELGVRLLDRHRSGARISREGRDLLQHMGQVLESVDRLRQAAGDQQVTARTVRVGTVNAATSTLLAPAIREFRTRRAGTQVEVVDLQQTQIHQSLLDGSLDLGLVNLLAGDDPAPDLLSTELLQGRPVVVCRWDSPLAGQPAVTLEELRKEQLIAMRSGYLMNRFTHRLFGHDLPPIAYSTDGAEMGKVMVAEGLGVTVLPDYSVTGDPLERAGVITCRPLADDRTTVTLVLQRRREERTAQPVRDLYATLMGRAAAHRSRAVAPAP